MEQKVLRVRALLSLSSTLALIALLGLTPPLVLTANAAELELQGEVLQPEQAQTAVTTGNAVMTRERQPLALEITLPELAASQRFVIKKPEPGTPLRVGLHRELPAGWRSDLSPVELAWREQEDGSYVSALSVRSPGAAGTRLATLFRSLPEETEIWHYSPGSPEKVYGPLGRDLVLASREGLGLGELFWSPLVSGDTIVLEVRVPDLQSTYDVRFSLRKVAHTLLDPQDRTFLKGIGDSGRCNKDLACKEQWAEAGDSVALIFFESGRYSSACSGQLVNHTHPDSDRYYLLTARHCISRQKEAKSATFLWFFQRARCRTGAVSTLVQTSAGARLRFKTPAPGRRKSTDHSLLQLRRPPPAGVTLSGWSTRDPSELMRADVAGIHHPMADLKKLSLGRVVEVFQLDTLEVRRPFTHLLVDWRYGITEPGSSGSGLWIGSDWPQQFLVGVLTGGVSECRSRDSFDFYGIFAETYSKYAKFRNLLNPSGD